ncbi:MAG: hypothetical protein ACLQIB_23855 [Isosphaeraceae bacterium]
MSTFTWTGAAPPGGPSRKTGGVSSQNGRQNAVVPRSWADCVSPVKMLVRDRPGLAVAMAFLGGVTLGWIIKR